MAFWDDWNKKDWNGPLVEMLHTAFLLALDTVKILILFGLATGLEKLLDYMGVKKLHLFGHEYAASQIIENFDYTLLVMFLLALIWRVGSNLRE